MYIVISRNGQMVNVASEFEPEFLYTGFIKIGDNYFATGDIARILSADEAEDRSGGGDRGRPEPTK